jgi:hypothetical protein
MKWPEIYFFEDDLVFLNTLKIIKDKTFFALICRTKRYKKGIDGRE